MEEAVAIWKTLIEFEGKIKMIAHDTLPLKLPKCLENKDSNAHNLEAYIEKYYPFYLVGLYLYHRLRTEEGDRIVKRNSRSITLRSEMILSTLTRFSLRGRWEKDDDGLVLPEVRAKVEAWYKEPFTQWILGINRINFTVKFDINGKFPAITLEDYVNTYSYYSEYSKIIQFSQYFYLDEGNSFKPQILGMTIERGNVVPALLKKTITEDLPSQYVLDVAHLLVESEGSTRSIDKVSDKVKANIKHYLTTYLYPDPIVDANEEIALLSRLRFYYGVLVEGKTVEGITVRHNSEDKNKTHGIFGLPF